MVLLRTHYFTLLIAPACKRTFRYDCRATVGHASLRQLRWVRHRRLRSRVLPARDGYCPGLPELRGHGSRGSRRPRGESAERHHEQLSAFLLNCHCRETRIEREYRAYSAPLPASSTAKSGKEPSERTVPLVLWFAGCRDHSPLRWSSPRSPKRPLTVPVMTPVAVLRRKRSRVRPASIVRRPPSGVTSSTSWRLATWKGVTGDVLKPVSLARASCRTRCFSRLRMYTNGPSMQSPSTRCLHSIFAVERRLRFRVEKRRFTFALVG